MAAGRRFDFRSLNGPASYFHDFERFAKWGKELALGSPNSEDTIGSGLPVWIAALWLTSPPLSLCSGHQTPDAVSAESAQKATQAAEGTSADNVQREL